MSKLNFMERLLDGVTVEWNYYSPLSPRGGTQK